MASIIDNANRPGNFSSSNIYKLATPGKSQYGFNVAGLTYINERNIERKLGLSLKQDVYTKPIAWGDFIELWVHEKILGLKYRSVGQITLDHPIIEFWKGSPDFDCASDEIVAECKGYERKNFAIYANAIMTGSTEVLKSECPDEYWQLVSNAIIMGYDKIQPIVFMPYQSEFPEIMDFISNLSDFQMQNDFKYIHDAILFEPEKPNLPYLLDGGYYKNFTTCILEIPKADKDFLTERVLTAGKLLVPFFIK